MTADAQSMPNPQGGSPKRRLRNYLLDPKFQLKYTGMVLLVTVAVASSLGFVAYGFSQGQTEALTAQMAAQPDLNPETATDLERFAEQEDRKIRNAIIVGVLMLLISVIRERINVGKTERYKDVER